MLSDILPGQIRPQPVHFGSIVSNEKYEVFGAEISRAFPRCKWTGLKDLCISEYVLSTQVASAAKSPSGENATHQLDNLAPYDILHQVDGLW
jgi:hypothetical protein